MGRRLVHLQDGRVGFSPSFSTLGQNTNLESIKELDWIITSSYIRLMEYYYTSVRIDFFNVYNDRITRLEGKWKYKL